MLHSNLHKSDSHGVVASIYLEPISVCHHPATVSPARVQNPTRASIPARHLWHSFSSEYEGHCLHDAVLGTVVWREQ